MVGLFDPPQVTQEPLFDPPANTGWPLSEHSEDQKGITASLAAVTEKYTTSTDESLDSIMLRAKGKIDNGQEADLRTSISDSAKDRAIAGYRQQQLDRIKGINFGYDGPTMKDLLSKELAVHASGTDYNALEKEGVQNLQDLSMVDPHEATSASSAPDVLNQVRDNLTKTAIFNRYLDAAKVTAESQGLPGKIYDFILGAVPGLQKITTSGLSLNPAGDVNRQMAELWKLPVDEFANKMPEIMDKANTYAGVLGSDPAAAARYLESLNTGVHGQNYFDYNALAALDVIAIPGVTKILGKSLSFLQATGNRAAASSEAASKILGQGNKIVSADESIANSIPTINMPSTSGLVRPYVGVNTDIADDIDAVTAASRVLDLPNASSYTPQQISEAVSRTIRAVKTRFKPFSQDIADVRPAQEVEPPAPGMVRMYHGGAEATSGGDRWFTTDQRYAQGYADKSESQVWYKDIPENHYLVTPEYADQGIKQGFTFMGELPAEDAKLLHSPRSFEDKVQVNKDESTGRQTINVFFGREAGSGGYSSPEAAYAGLVRKGWEGQADLYQNIDRQWFIRFKTDVSDQGIVTPSVTETDLPNTGRWFKDVATYLKNMNSIMPEAWNATRIKGVLDRAKIYDNVYKPMFNVIRSLSGKGTRQLEDVIKIGQQEEKWYSLPELDSKYLDKHKRLPTDAERKAYYAYKDINDTNYRIENHYLYKEKAADGYVTVQIGKDAPEAIGIDTWENEGGLVPGEQLTTRRVNARINTRPDWTERILDQESGIHYSPGQAKDELIRKWETGQYRLLELERPPRFKGEPVKSVLVHKNSYKESQLEYNQLGYRQGGTWENKNRYFVKQRRTGTFNDSTPYETQPVTHISAPTNAAASRWSGLMERARLAYNKEGAYANLSEVERRLIVEQAPWSGGSYDTFDNLVKTNKIQSNHKFEVLYDEEVPEALRGVNDNLKWLNKNESARSQSYWGRGQMYFSPRGEHLKDPEGQLGRVFDPFVSTDRAVSHAVRTAAFSDYNRQVINDWSALATKYLRNPTPDPIENFFHGELDASKLRSNEILRQNLKATRKTHKRFMGLVDPTEKNRDRWARTLAEFVDNKPGGQALAQKAFDLADRNPTNAIKGFVFDAYLGVANIGQFFVQATTGVAAITVHPLYGARAAASLPAWTHVLMNRSENLLDFYSRQLPKVTGMAPAEWKAMVKTYIDEGWGNVGSSTTLLDSMSGKVGGSVLGKFTGNVRDIGRQPFYLGEKFNRVVGFNIAWNKTRSEFPELVITSDAFKNKVRTATDNLTLNMTSASKAAWSQGIMSLPTTFMQYQAHMLEAILPQALGGSKAFQGAAKARLFATQMMLYGAGGYGSVETSRWINSQYKAATGHDMAPDLYRLVSKGLIDSFLNYASGGALDTDLSSRVGPTNGFAQFFERAFNGDISSAADLFLGPLGTETGTVIDAATKLGRYFAAESVDQISPAEWQLMGQEALKTIKTFSYATKAYYIYQMGKLKAKDTDDTVVPASQMEAIAAFLGVPLAAETERWADINSKKSWENSVREVGNELSVIRGYEFDALSKGDDKSATEYQNIIKTHLGLYADDPFKRNAIIQQMNSVNNRSTGDYENLLNQMSQHMNVTSPYKPRTN